MSNKYQLPPGVFDILPSDSREPWRSSFLWQYVEGTIREIAQRYGYLEMRTPILEKTELFQRSVGESSDIVSKEMYTFEDRGGRSLSLRPEGTAAALRAFINGQLQNIAPVHKLFYIGPMFRYDRPQAGRYRQHHQFGAEAIGVHAPEQDVEMIDMAYTIYSCLGLRDLRVDLNSIGDEESRQRYRQALLDYLTPYKEDLSEESQTRLTLNPLRILDSKNPRDRELCAEAPSILEHLSAASQEYFTQVKHLLEDLGIPYQTSSALVRGLDYYNEIVFEVVSGSLGAQNSIGGGGRYDGLLAQLGGPDLPGVGFATGIERVIQTMLKQEIPLPSAPHPQLFLIALGEPARRHCFTLLKQLRENGVDAQMDFTSRKLGKVMSFADHLGAEYVAVIGDSELEGKQVDLKQMDTGQTKKVALDELAQVING